MSWGQKSGGRQQGNWKAGHRELDPFSMGFLLCENYWCSGILTESRFLEQ